MQQISDGLLVPPQEPPNVEMVKIAKSFENGYKWFYWIAGLSLINSAAHLAKGDFSFVIGLGITQIVDGIALEIVKQNSQASMIVNIVAFGLAAVFAGLFALFGFLAGRRHGWAFIVGLVLYVFDGLIFLLVQDWLSVGFHAFAFFCIMTGYINLKKLNQLQEFELRQQEITQIPAAANTVNA